MLKIICFLPLLVAVSAYSYQCHNSGSSIYTPVIGTSWFQSAAQEKVSGVLTYANSHHLNDAADYDAVFDQFTSEMHTYRFSLAMSESFLTNSPSNEIATVTNFMSKTISSTKIYADKYCLMLDRNGCQVGTVRGAYFIGKVPSTVSFKAMFVNDTQSNFTFSGGVPEPDKYPWDVVTAIPKTPMDGSLCKRSATPPMIKCAGADTLISGQTLWAGQSLISPMGFHLHLETNGNLCMYDPRDVNYWCAGIVPTGPAPYKMYLEADGNVCFYDGNDKNYLCLQRNGPINNQNRLTMQDNGLFATYDAAGKLIGVVSSNGIKSFPFPIQPACTGPTLS